ncbi:MAG: hypothetical protein LBV13_04890 [Methanomassiliicoccaceae archaeon]|jgi:hypothetical protein|nr:hypothetical protein [Methanomassiliicoccaceae archaeon]
MKKCLYCNRPFVEGVCNDECDNKYEEFKIFFEKWYKKSIVIILLTCSFFSTAILYPKEGLLISGIVLSLIGVELFFLPFATPQTIKSMGVKGSVELCIKYSKYFIVTGIILIVIGILIRILIPIK